MNLATHMPAVARHLLGDPNSALSSKRELRYGTNGSLAVDVAKGTFYDHENQNGGGVLALIERETKLANGLAIQWLRDELGIELEADSRQIVAEYDYTDETGKLLFQAVRFSPKGFSQRQPDGRGGWEWSIKGVRPVPFHLPQLLAADSRTIHIVEGEKDALTLERLGLVATCNSGGAGKWRPEFSQFLRGADVVVLPDNDDAGEAHAGQVAGMLRGTAERVRIVHLPNLPPKGDVSDWIAAGGTVAKLAEICEAPEIAEPHTGHCLSLADWLARDISPPDNLLGELLSTTSRLILSAPTGLGKTNFVMALAFAMAAGRSFLHWQASRAARILFVDGEMSRRLMKVRLTDAARRQGEIPDSFFVLCRDDVAAMPPLNTVEGQAFIDGTVEQLGGVDLIIFDNVMSLISGDMKEELGWSQTLPWIKSLTKRSIGQLWVHHTGHDQSRSYGTSTREWQLDTSALLEPVERPGTDIAFTLKFSKARERAPHNRADFEPVVITLSRDQWDVEMSDGKKPDIKRKEPSPLAKKFHGALVSATVATGRVRTGIVSLSSVTMTEWEDECARRGLIDRENKRKSASAMMSKYRVELIASDWVSCDREFIWNRTVAA